MVLCACCCGDKQEGRKTSLFEIQEEEEEHESLLHDHSFKREKQVLLHTKAKKRQTVWAQPLDIHDDDDDYQPPHYPKTPQDCDFLSAALGDNFIFSHLNQEERKRLVDAMQKEEVGQGTAIITEGQDGDYFYIVQQGIVDIVADGVNVGSYTSPGESFGELALLYNSPRAATCLATTDCCLWKVDQLTFRLLLARQAHEEERGIKELLGKISLFAHFNEGQLGKFIDACTSVSYTRGERIVTKGDVGDVFYIVQEGTVKIHDIGLGDSQFVDQVLTAGDWFGERALLTGEVRAANVTAVSDCTCLAMSREVFEKTLGPLRQIVDHFMRKQFLKSVPIFSNSNFEDHEMNKLAEFVTELCYEKGQKLCEAGQPYRQELWIIESGKLLVVGEEGKLYQLKSGDYFGDKSIKSAKGRISSHTAIFEEDSTCWVLTREDIESVIGDINRLGESIPFMASTVNKKIKLKHLNKLKLLGMGAFGRVWLMTSKEDGTPYALKMMDKRQLLKAGQIQSVVREKTIMSSIDHPFVLPLVSSFQDEHSLYLLLDLIQGGELFNVVHTEKRNGVPNYQARFYAACISKALAHLHTRNICYRDLKPENVLIDSQGYCVVVDLGFAKVVVDKTYTLCGTPEYLAPEIVMSRGHNKAVDWWAFGVLVFELLVGQSPFFAPGMDQVSLFKRIVMVQYYIPDTVVNAKAKDLIQKLLVRKQSARLGNLSRGYRDVEEHPWFEAVDFRQLLKKDIKAPWVPEIESALDDRYFDDFSAAERGFQRQGPPLGDEQQELFKDF